MESPRQQIWITSGYTLFAQQGPNGLKIEQLARIVGKSKSSFYHHFADLDLFISMLFEYHLERSSLVYEAAAACESMVPGLLNVILTYKEDLFFHRQVRINRHLPNYTNVMESFHRPVEEAFLGIWAKALHLDRQHYIAQALLGLVVDNFYMRVTREHLNPEWLTDYFQEIITMVESIKRGKHH